MASECPFCRTVLRDGAIVCPGCGAELRASGGCLAVLVATIGIGLMVVGGLCALAVLLPDDSGSISAESIKSRGGVLAFGLGALVAGFVIFRVRPSMKRQNNWYRRSTID